MEVNSHVMLRSKAMEVINTGQPFTMEFVSCDRRRGTGGDLVKVVKWMRLRKDTEVAKAPAGFTKEHVAKKDMRHHENKTFVIFNPANRVAHPITVHFRLIQSLNGKQVING